MFDHRMALHPLKNSGAEGQALCIGSHVDAGHRKQVNVDVAPDGFMTNSVGGCTSLSRLSLNPSESRRATNGQTEEHGAALPSISLAG